MYAAISSLSHRAAAVKLVVFDADRQHELLRLESFSLGDLKQVNAAVEKWKLGPVDYHALQRGEGSVDIVAALINEQLRADPPPDLVVFVDPGSWYRFRDASARQALKIPHGPRPRFFALQFGPSPADFQASQYLPGRGFPGGQPASGRQGGTARGGRAPGQGPVSAAPKDRDKIRPAVARLGGKTFFMSSPAQLPKAVAEIEKRAGGKP
jgi:hypothetical protein